MKQQRILAFLAVLLLTSLSSRAQDSSEAHTLIEQKQEIVKEFSSMGCAELRAGLPELAESVDALRFVKQDSVDFALAIFSIKKAIERSKDCISQTSGSG